VEEGGITAVCLTTPWPWDSFETAVKRTEEYYALARTDPKLLLVESAADIRRAKAEGKVGMILWSQGLNIIGDHIPHIESLFRLGYRILQLTYSERNYLGDGCDETSDVGLSKLGRAAVKELNRLHILVDVSHSGPRTSLDAAELSEQPIIVSHANPRSLYDHPRNISDELIKAVAAKGGVIGACPYAPINWDGDPTHKPNIDNLVASIDHMVQMVGIDHVGLGTDSEATEGAYPAEVIAELGRRYPDLGGPFRAAFGRARMEGFRGMRDFPLITEKLLNHGYKPDDVAKVIGGNWLRVFETVWPS
jgi:membrane dipeptidase